MFHTPEETEVAFYTALERADLGGMMEVWADDDNIACVHPMGPRLEGREEVSESWRRIFGNGARMRFRLSDIQELREGDVVVHVVHENITVSAGRSESTVLATNIYRLVGDSWHMVLHHASPAPSPQDEEEDEDDDGPKVLH